ncbi:unnamed protein product [Parnassius mnemosyne]|uniref:Cubilin n=1 Tax=Parnassius mnemosyne TaxID=213953 RepID=A0AAV1K6H0_9NEOP
MPVTSGDGIKCICDQGWTTNGTGIACLTDINECESSQGSRCSVNPRVECINLPGSFRCGECPSGYEGNGYVCYDIDECVTLPNGGCSVSPFVACHNTIGSRFCGPCPPGYLGDGVTCTWIGSCNINHGGCHPAASCVDKWFGSGRRTQCVCPNGMDGDGVGLDGCYISTEGNATQHCESNPCSEHGQCHALRTGYTCICHKGFTGVHCENTANLCANYPCRNGGSCIVDENSSTGFRCECTALFSGDLCQSHSNLCGGVLNHEEGSIIYPVSNTTYSHNARCAWVIHTSPDKVINVTFSKFNLETNPECQYDFLQIHDGRSSASQLLGRFCGVTFPLGGNIISSHNNLYFWFRSDQTVAKDGFALHWTSIDPVCGGEIDASTHGHITSPGSRGKYPPNRDCYWHLTTTFGKRILLHFFELDIEAHPNCSFDYVAIYDGGHITDPLLEKYCNSTLPGPVQSVSSELLIHFHSDAYGSGYGFRITFAPVEGIPGCGGYFTEYRGEISSPTYNGKYLNNIVCEYKIKTSEGTKIRINFITFSIESSFRCKYDNLKIYDGPSSDSRLVGKFCGKNYLKSYTSSSNALFIRFKSDHTMSSEGFRITYEAICHKTLYGDSGVIKSPGYPFRYPENRVCEYIISTTPGKAIQLTFQDFDIESNRYSNCQYDNVEIRDGPDINSTLLGTFCGGSEHIPPVQTSTFNYMYIRFKSDMSVSGTGFYANYTTIDTECGGIHRETSGEINHPSATETNYKNDQTCTWIIIAPEGMHIKLTWNRFKLENHIRPSCSTDYVELYEIDDENQRNFLGRYCKSSSPPALTSSTNRLMIKFESDSSIRESGFSLSYTFLDEKSHCGGLFVKPHGYIYSPGWPNTYEPYRDCIWTITVLFGQQIMLNISQFDLERPIRDKCDLGDFLEIKNGASENSPLIGKYCGSFKSKRILSTANSLYLHFHSDYYLSGRGFIIEWDGSITGCGGTLTSISGSISSPNYPDNYNENAECFYRLVTSSGSKIRISFTELDLEKTPNCRDDYIEIFDGRDTNAVSLGKHCSMSSILSNIVTTTNYAYIKFRSDIHLGGKGFKASFTMTCGAYITAHHDGIISNDHFVKNSNESCTWTLLAPKPSQKIKLTITHMSLSKDTTVVTNRACPSTYLRVLDGDDDNSPLIDEFCGNKIPPMIVSHGSAMTMKLGTYIGNITGKFSAHYSTLTSACGGVLTSEEGTIASPNYPQSYPIGSDCEWILSTSPGYRISLKFIERFVIEDRPNCTKDVLIVYDWKDNEYIEIAKLCGRRLPPAYNSTFNQMKVIFRTDAEINLDGFRAQWTDICGGNYIATENEQIIYSPGYNNEYVPSQNCEYRIQAVDNNIKVKFLSFDIEGTYPLCEYDNVTITAHSPSEYIYQVYCGKELPPLIENVADVQVLFSTDRYSNKKGFKLAYSIYFCGGKINNNTVITFDKYEHNLNCTWIIEAPVNKIVVLRFVYIDLESNSECYNDYIAAYNGLIIDPNKRLALMCGRVNSSTVIKSASNEMLLQFVTDSSVSYKGFQVEVIFTFSESAGCGGQINLAPTSSQTLKSPLIGNSVVYESYLDCSWYIKAPEGYVVSIEFISFHISSCHNVNQTALGISKCDCDLVEIRDGINPDSLVIDTFCGHTLPPQIHSSLNHMLIRLKTDGEIASSGFEITLTAKESICGRSLYPVSHNVQILKSPRYDTGYIPRGLHCSYRLDSHAEIYSTVRLTVKNLDLRPGSVNINKCNYDRLLITSSPYSQNISIGKEFILNPQTNSFYDVSNFYEQTFPSSLELCGNKKSVDLYITGDVLINLQTTSEADLRSYKGFEIEFVFTGFCGRNYTDPQGRLKALNPTDGEEDKDCYTLITAPENNTIALYFFFISPDYYSNDVYLEIFDGDKRSAPRLVKIVKEFSEYTAVFSTGRNLLLYNHPVNKNQVTFDSNYVVTNKGRGCGGKLHNVVGRVASPMYPAIYRHKNICEWELETPHGSRLMLHFAVFDLGVVCDQNYVQLVDRNGNTISTYCSEIPADYTSLDNYVKIVFITNMNNGGTGWVADFVAVL